VQKFKPQYRRLLFIDRKIKEGSYPNCVSLGQEWEVSGRTIQRDIDYLRDELDAPIGYDMLKRGFYYTEPSFSLPAISVSESDLFSVCVAQTVLSQFKSTPLFQKLSSVFEKIRDALPDKTTVHPSWMSERILVFPEAATNVDTAIWDTLAKAIRDNRRVSISHRSPGQESPGVTQRTVDPYYLVNYKGEWYLSSYCHHRKAIRTFAVSRIAQASILDESFRMPAGMTKQKMFGDQFGIIWKDKFHKVRIRFSPEVAPYIRERHWHPLQQIKAARNGGLVLEFTTNHLNEVKDWVLSWGAGATVLAPRPLIEKVTFSLKQAAAHYARKQDTDARRLGGGAGADG
jgi:predicted DNA-binding transcriptional regulator YafY